MRDQRAVIANELSFAGMARGGGDGLRGRHGRESVTEAINHPAFNIDATQTVRRTVTRGRIKQSAGLRGVRDVASKKNDTRRTQEFEPGALHTGQLRAFQTNY